MQISSSISIWNNNIAAFSGGGASYIVDDYGAFDFFSVRLGSASYSGALVRIRRSSDSAEKDFYPDSNEELSMSSEDGAGTSLSTWISTDSGYIVTWYNQGSNAQNVTQSTGANQPRIINAGTLETKNSKTGIYFDGTDNLSQVTYNGITEPFGAWAVGSNEVNAAAGALMSTRSGGAQEGFVLVCDRRTNKNLFFADYGAGFDLWDLSAQVNSANQRICSGILTAALDGNSYYNGTLQTNASGTTVPARAVLEIGSQVGATKLTGFIQEVMTFDTDQTSNRADIESNVNGYFATY